MYSLKHFTAYLSFHLIIRFNYLVYNTLNIYSYLQ